jgi:hypothetical protein
MFDLGMLIDIGREKIGAQSPSHFFPVSIVGHVPGVAGKRCYRGDWRVRRMGMERTSTWTRRFGQLMLSWEQRDAVRSAEGDG